MSKFIATCLTVATLLVLSTAQAEDAKPNEDGWICLFDGKTFGQWKINERPESWRIEDGAIIAQGERSHLFYTGGEFKNFEFKADVMSKPGSNSGIYFHTKYQDEGWPTHGYETQVNNSHVDPVKTGSLYNTVKLLESEAEDDTWWTQHIIVRGNRVIVKIDGKQVLDYTEPEGKEGTVKIGKGTFALQAHDPQSEVRFKNLQVKPLP